MQECKNLYVEKVKTYKYLGCIIQEDLNWDNHITSQIKKKLFLLRQLNKLKVDSKILCLYYNAMISSVATYVFGSWYNSELWHNPTASTGTDREASYQTKFSKEGPPNTAHAYQRLQKLCHCLNKEDYGRTTTPPT